MQRNSEFFKKLAKEIKHLGFRCFLYESEMHSWMSVITPNNSWLEIFHGMYGGYDITYQYVPSRDFGSGCRYNEDALWEITSETLLKAEQYGKQYHSVSKRYRTIKSPKHYENGLNALLNSYFGKEYVEL